MNCNILARWLVPSALSLLTLHADAAEPNLSAASPKPAPSSGLLNDWLRAENPAFEPWDFGGQLRARYELFDGASPAFPTRDFQRKGVDNDNSYLWTRERLHLGYKSSWFSVYGEALNSNSDGDEDPREPGEDSFDLHQAFVVLGNSKEVPLSLKLGRQELIYGDERLLGAADWANVPRAFDAAKLRFENESFWLDAFAGRVVLPDDVRFDEPNHHDWLFGLYGSSTKLVPFQETQVYFLSRNSGVGAAASPRDIYSVGARVKSLPGKFGGWDYFGEGVAQFGSVNQADERRTQEAFALGIGGGYTWKKAFLTPRLGLEYDYSSGDSDPADSKSETLDNLFPTNHKPYGLMDLVGWRNIHDARLSAGIKPHAKLSLTLDWHLFWLADTHDFFYPQAGAGRAANGYGRNDHYENFLGSEVDLEAGYTVTEWAALRAGYGHFFTGSYIDSTKDAVGGAVDADWFYLQATVNF